MFMGVKIFIRDSEVLDLQNANFSIIYVDLLSLINEEKIKISSELSTLIDELYTGCFEEGLDLEDFLKNQEDALLFAMLVNKVLSNTQENSAHYSPNIRKILLNFEVDPKPWRVLRG